MNPKEQRCVQSRLSTHYCRIASDFAKGVKRTPTYEQDPKLFGYVMDLQRFERILKESVEKGYVRIEERELKGVEDLTFEI